MVETSQIKEGYKNSELGLIPQDWKVAPVSQFGEVKRGAGSQYIKYVSFNGVRLIRINDFFEDNPVFIEPTSDIIRFKITDYDVLFAGTGASAGASYIPKKEWIGLPHSYNAPRIRTNKNNSKEFLLHALQSEYIAKQQKAWFVGAAQPFLDLNAISSFLIACPPTKEEQIEIANALNDIDKLSIQLELSISKKRNIKLGAMQELLKPKDEWAIKKIQNLIDENIIIGHLDGNHGELYPRSNEFKETGVPYIGATDFENGNVNFSTCKFLPSERAKLFKKGIAKDGDVLFAHNATVGPVAFLKTKLDYVILSTTATYFRCDNKKLINGYLFYALQAPFFTDQYKAVMLQSTRAQVPITQQRKFDLLIPSPEEQIRISTILLDIEDEIYKLEEQLNKYRLIKQGMMQNLLTGKIRLV